MTHGEGREGRGREERGRGLIPPAIPGYTARDATREEEGGGDHFDHSARSSQCPIH